MRTLPSRPSLDHLKQQAKDLLPALRESEPGASLADAQRTLAQQYGFRSWTELKAEVERQSSEDSEGDPDLVAAITDRFGLGNATVPARVVTEDVMGPVLRIETDKGRWSAHAVLDWVDDEQIAEAVRLMEAAAQVGVSTPTAVRTPTGSLLAQAGGRSWRVVEWMDLGPSLARPVPSDAALRVGEIMATLHGLALAPTRPMNPWLTQRRTPERWQEVMEAAERTGAPWAPQLAAALPAIVDLSKVGVEPPPGGLILSHTNLVPANLRTGPAGSPVVLGWEFAGAIPPEWELGYVLHAWTEIANGRVNESAARPILDGYASVGGSSPKLDVSIFSSAITAWLNWLASRIAYALEGEGDERDRAARELTNMLAFPLTPDVLARVLYAAGGR